MDAPRLDHIVYAAPDLDHAVVALEKQLGVRAVPGGRHPGLGTHNALLALSAESYVELIGPDPTQPDPAGPRPFGIDSLERGRVATWAVRASGLDARVAQARAAGFDAGRVIPVSRATPDGGLLAWQLTVRFAPAGDGLVPFLIDWGTTSHPAATAPPGCSLVELRGEHPDPEQVQRDLRALGTALDVNLVERPALVAVLDTPNGRVELR